jgi:hypothetical protein
VALWLSRGVSAPTIDRRHSSGRQSSCDAEEPGKVEAGRHDAAVQHRSAKDRGLRRRRPGRHAGVVGRGSGRPGAAWPHGEGPSERGEERERRA